MKVFVCQACGHLLYFENVRCERCGRALGFLPDRLTISTIEPSKHGLWSALAAKGQQYRFCKNWQLGVCNWMLLTNSPEEFSAACRHNHLIPDLSRPENLELWRKLEFAKHRLFYTLLR